MYCKAHVNFMLYFCGTVAKRKSIFDDKPEEIQQLTYIIKQDIGSLNSQIGQLQEVSLILLFRVLKKSISEYILNFFFIVQL